MAEQETYVAWIAQLFPRQGEWTEEDYFALPETNRIIELSDGKIIMSPPPVPAHQIIINNLDFHLTGFVRENQLGVVIPSPVAVRLWAGKIRGPDLLFLRTERLDQIGKKLIDGAPDWVAEVISPRSRRLDSVTKVQEYAQAGVLEYWLLDPKSTVIRMHLLHEHVYRVAATYHPGDLVRSETIIGFEIPVDEVFRR